MPAEHAHTQAEKSDSSLQEHGHCFWTKSHLRVYSNMIKLWMVEFKIDCCDHAIISDKSTLIFRSNWVIERQHGLKPFELCAHTIHA